MIFSVIALILSGICFLYYIAVGSYAGFASPFVSFWIFVTSFFLLIGVFNYFMIKKQIYDKINNIFKMFFGIVSVILIITFILILTLVISKMWEFPDEKVDFVIVLGAKVNGEKPSKTLIKRLDKTLEYLEKNEECLIIVSGGQGKDEDISEAEAMKRYLVDKGIEDNRIIKEDKSTSTNENLDFSKTIIDSLEKGENIAIVSNNFHIFRAEKLAIKKEFDNLQMISADTENILIPNYVIRECFAVIKEVLYGNIDILDN